MRSQSEGASKGAWNAITVLYMDTEANQLIELGGAAWLTAEELQQEWNRIPTASEQRSPFLADLYRGDERKGCSVNRSVN